MVGAIIGLAVGFLMVDRIQGFFDIRPDAEPRMITPRPDLTTGEQTTIDLFEKASPSVVYITSIAHRRSRFGLNVFEIPQGAGSGFVWDDQGHIVTNFHVIKNANSVRVTLSDNTTVEAKLVGVEPSKDLAVLKITVPAGKLEPIAVGTSRDLRVGQSVLAIGNPFGLDHTLTTGVVSALGRTIPSFNNRTIEGVIQTDAAINPGNSGGPLLDSAGRLIGVNTQITSPSGASAGIGFAVPVDIVNRVVPQLIQYGAVVRPRLGINPVPDHLARRLRLKGVIIGAVSEGSGADAAGLEGLTQTGRGDAVLGDVIQAIENRQIADFNDLMTALENHKAGDIVTVTFLRDGKTQKTKVTLGAGH